MQCYTWSNELSQFHTVQDSQRPSTDKAMPQLKKKTTATCYGTTKANIRTILPND